MNQDINHLKLWLGITAVLSVALSHYAGGIPGQMISISGLFFVLGLAYFVAKASNEHKDDLGEERFVHIEGRSEPLINGRWFAFLVVAAVLAFMLV